MSINLKPKDYYLAAFVGLLTGLFTIPVLSNSGYHNHAVFAALPVVLAIAWAVGLWLGKTLASFWGVIFQLAKFSEVGFLNTAISFGVLNIISLITGVTAGLSAGGINVPGTAIAAVNSYTWNKLWVFPIKDKRSFLSDAPKFLIVTLAGVVINSLIVAAFTSYLAPRFGLNSGAWLNVGKVVATVANFFVDFLGYKFLVFVRKK